MTPAEAFKSNPVMLIANIIVIVGALNWLGVGLQNVNYVSKYLGDNARFVFILVGLAGLYLTYTKVMWFMNKPVEGWTMAYNTRSKVATV